jgi:hypothetical protein
MSKKLYDFLISSIIVFIIVAFGLIIFYINKDIFCYYLLVIYFFAFADALMRINHILKLAMRNLQKLKKS